MSLITADSSVGLSAGFQFLDRFSELLRTLSHYVMGGCVSSNYATKVIVL